MTTKPLSQIRKFTLRRRRLLLSRKAVARTAGVLIVYLAITAALGGAFAVFPWTLLPVFWLSATALSGVLLLLLPLLLLFRRPSLVQTAAIIEEKSDLPHPALSLALELSQQNCAGGSSSLKELAYDRAADQLDIMKKVRFPVINKYVFAAALVLLIVNAGIATMSPNKLTNYWRLPLALISGTQARVSPGSITVPLNSSVTLELSGAAQQFPTARLEIWSLAGQNRSRHFLRADTAGNFAFSVDSIKESFVYQFSMSSAMSPETVIVIPPPLLRSLQVSLTPPRYTRLPPRELPAGQGNITAYPGTEVSVAVESNVLNRAGVIIGNTCRGEQCLPASSGSPAPLDTILLDVNGRTATGKFTVTRSTEYTFFLVDTLGQTSDTLPRFMISVLPDEPPVARILRPGANKILTTAQAETLFVEGIDDFGISRMELRWFYSGDHPDEAPETWNLSEAGSPPIVRKSVSWNIRELEMYPGDTLYYWLWVRDNRAGRPQTAVSDTFWFRMPSFEEIHRSIVEREQYAQEKLGEARRRQDNISGAVDRLIRSAAGTNPNNELTWDQKRVIDDVKEQLQAQADSLQKAFEALEDGMRAMREDGKMNDELFSKMEEIRKSIEELMKEFGEDLFKINTDQPMTMRDMQQAASQLRDMLPELSERLDQTLAFLERMRQEKELADLAVRAENLSNEQAGLAASGDSLQNDRRQQDLLDRIDNFNEDVRKLFEQRVGAAPPSLQQVQELSKEMRGNDNSQDGNQNGNQNGNNNQSGGQCQLSQNKRSRQNAMSRELRTLGEQLSSNLMVNMMKKIEEDRRRILSMAHDAISLEEWQQLIRFQTLGTADNRGVALSQQALGNAIRMSLAKADSLTMVNSEIMRQIIRAYRAASEKSAAVIGTLAKTDGARQMEQSAQALRELAHLLLSITGGDDEGGGGGGGGGMMAGLRRASGRQAALNSAMGDMLQALMDGGRKPGQRGQGQQGQGQGQQGQGEGTCPLGGGNRPGGDTGGGGGEVEREARRQAREAQQAIADELKRLADAYGRDAGADMEKRVRELEQEARRLAQLLESPPMDIVDQQDRFLSRMLQATLSLNRKDEGKEERQGTVAQTPFSAQNIPASAGMSSQADSFHLLRKRAFEDNFPEEYRSAIREYFDALGEMLP